MSRSLRASLAALLLSFGVALIGPVPVQAVAPASATNDLNLTVDATSDPAGAVQYDGSFQGRTFILFVPNTPVTAFVLGLHGLDLNSSNLEQALDRAPEAAAKGWLMIFPDSTGESWNAGQCCGLAQQLKLDDAGYLAGLVATVRADFALAASAPTVGIGYSNGAMMLEELACRHPGLFAGLLLDKGNLEDPQCTSAAAPEIIQIRSQNDVTVPIGDPTLRSEKNVFSNFTGTYDLPDTATIRAFVFGGLLWKPHPTQPARLIKVQDFVVNRGSSDQRILIRVLEERSVTVHRGKQVTIIHGRSAHRFDSTAGVGYVSDSQYAARVITDAVVRG